MKREPKYNPTHNERASRKLVVHLQGMVAEMECTVRRIHRKNALPIYIDMEEIMNQMRDLLEIAFGETAEYK